MKKQILFFLLLCCICSSGLTQNYKRVDSIISQYPRSFSTPERLSNKIAADFSSDFDKVRAIYTWIAFNVIYDINESQRGTISYSSKEELARKEIQNKKRTAVRVIAKGKAVCHGYSTLFQTLCKNLNLESRYVTGYGKTFVKDIGRRYTSNHAWNIVRIDGKEYLFDSTWGGGDTTLNTTDEINFSYFLTAPKRFIKNHYPDDFKNALLKEKISKQSFVDGPLIYNFNFEVISPLKGTIKKGEKGRMLKFKFLTDKKVEAISCEIGNQTKHHIAFTNDTYLEFSVYISNLSKGRELTLFFDYKAVAGFKLE